MKTTAGFTRLISSLLLLSGLVSMYSDLNANCKHDCLHMEVTAQVPKTQLVERKSNRKNKKNKLVKKYDRKHKKHTHPKGTVPYQNDMNAPQYIAYYMQDGKTFCRCKNDYVYIPLTGSYNWIFFSGNEEIGGWPNGADILVGQGTAGNRLCPDCGHKVMDHDDDCSKYTGASQGMLPSGDRLNPIDVG